MALEDLPNAPGTARDAAILNRVQTGKYDPVAFSPVSSTWKNYSGTFQVFSDALKLDGVRIGAGAKLAQQIADVLGCLLLTPKLLDLTFLQAQKSGVVIPPQTMYDASRMMTTEWFKKHSSAIDAAIAKAGATGLVQTTGKPWMIDEALLSHGGRAENYGWHMPLGATLQGVPLHPSVTSTSQVIQQPGWAHGLDQADYSETVTLVRRDCVVDGQPWDVVDVLRDPERAGLLTANGKAQSVLRQPGVPILVCRLPNPPKGLAGYMKVTPSLLTIDSGYAPAAGGGKPAPDVDQALRYMRSQIKGSGFGYGESGLEVCGKPAQPLSTLSPTKVVLAAMGVLGLGALAAWGVKELRARRA